MVVTVSECASAGRLRLVNDAPARTEFGVIWVPAPVSRCTARQLTSTTRPRAAAVSSQSPIWNGCSNNMSRPEMIWPTEFCSVRPMTIEVMPSAVNRPRTFAPQMYEKITARPTAIRTNRATSTKIVGTRLRHVPAGAPGTGWR